MGNADCLDFQVAAFQLFTGLQYFGFDPRQVNLLIQLLPDHGDGEVGGIDRYIDFAQKIRKGTDVIFVGMSEDDRSQLVFVVDDILEIWDDDVDTVHFIARERETAIHHDHVFALNNQGAIPTDLSGTSERNDLNLSFHVVRGYQFCSP